MTALPWSTRCIKYLLFIFNLLFVITGIILISVGATVHGIYGTYSQFLDNGGYISTSAFMVAIGTIIFIISFFGCCGAVKENFCMTITFTALLILVFIFEFAAGISGYVLRDNTKDIVSHNLNVTMTNYLNSNESSVTVDYLQTTFHCCGIKDASDWGKLLNSTNQMLPVSCCDKQGILGNITCSLNGEIANTTLIHDIGCLDAFGDYVSTHAATLGGVALGIAFVQLLGIAFSCHLSKQIKQYQSV